MRHARLPVVYLVTQIKPEEWAMKTLTSSSVLGAIAGAAMLLPLAVTPAAAQVPGGSYLQSCRDAHLQGDRLVATCRTEQGDWNRTALSNIGRCAGGVANSDGRLVCGTHRGDMNVGSSRGDRERDGNWHQGYGGPYGPNSPDRDAWGRWQGGPDRGWGPVPYGR
jgi:hypothetical protein